MPNENAGTASSDTPACEIPVSPDNPCPFLRALVAGGFVGGHVVPLATLGQAIEAASGEQGLQKKLVGMKTFPIALSANGLNPLRLLRNWWSGAVLDNLRNGPLDKHGVGSRILDATAHVNEAEIARLAEFGKDRQDPAGGTERGLTADEITKYMDANFARAKGNRRWYDRILMMGEWPVLLNIMGKGEGKARYLSVAEVRTLFVDRQLPERIVERLKAEPPSMQESTLHKFGKVAFVAIALFLAAIVAIAGFSLIGCDDSTKWFDKPLNPFKAPSGYNYSSLGDTRVDRPITANDLMDANGKFEAVISYREKDAAALAKLRNLVAGAPSS